MIMYLFSVKSHKGSQNISSGLQCNSGDKIPTSEEKKEEEIKTEEDKKDEDGSGEGNGQTTEETPKPGTAASWCVCVYAYMFIT